MAQTKGKAMVIYWPVRVEDGIFISQRFGEHALDYSQFGLIGHNGIDYAADLGTKIYAPVDGYVIEQTAKDTGFGLRICMRTDQDGKHYQMVFGHMERLERPINMPWVWENKAYKVKAGDVIGYVDSTGFSTGNHLHFGLYEMTDSGSTLNTSNGYNGAIDPAPFMAGELDKPNMKQFKTQNYKGELRIILQADDMTTWEALCKVYGVDPKNIDEIIN